MKTAEIINQPGTPNPTDLQAEIINRWLRDLRQFSPEARKERLLDLFIVIDQLSTLLRNIFGQSQSLPEIARPTSPERGSHPDNTNKQVNYTIIDSTLGLYLYIEQYLLGYNPHSPDDPRDQGSGTLRSLFTNLEVTGLIQIQSSEKNKRPDNKQGASGSSIIDLSDTSLTFRYPSTSQMAQINLSLINALSSDEPVGKIFQNLSEITILRPQFTIVIHQEALTFLEEFKAYLADQFSTRTN